MPRLARNPNHVRVNKSHSRRGGFCWKSSLQPLPTSSPPLSQIPIPHSTTPSSPHQPFPLYSLDPDYLTHLYYLSPASSTAPLSPYRTIPARKDRHPSQTWGGKGWNRGRIVWHTFSWRRRTRAGLNPNYRAQLGWTGLLTAWTSCTETITVHGWKVGI